jgi:hypothetical protein
VPIDVHRISDLCARRVLEECSAPWLGGGACRTARPPGGQPRNRIAGPPSAEPFRLVWSCGGSMGRRRQWGSVRKFASGRYQVQGCLTAALHLTPSRQRRRPAVGCRSPRFRSLAWAVIAHPQRGSNPCLHLERAVKAVHSVYDQAFHAVESVSSPGVPRRLLTNCRQPPDGSRLDRVAFGRGQGASRQWTGPSSSPHLRPSPSALRHIAASTPIGTGLIHV